MLSPVITNGLSLCDYWLYSSKHTLWLKDVPKLWILPPICVSPSSGSWRWSIRSSPQANAMSCFSMTPFCSTKSTPRMCRSYRFKFETKMCKYPQQTLSLYLILLICLLLIFVYMYVQRPTFFRFTNFRLTLSTRQAWAGDRSIIILQHVKKCQNSGIL